MRQLILLALLLAACAPSAPENNDIVGDSRNAPTQPPPIWVESASEITLDTVPQIRLLGRLDNPTTPSTIFHHALSPDGTRLAGLDNEQLVVWDLITGETVFATARREATKTYFAADKTEVYTVELSGLVTAHDAENGQEQNTFVGIEEFDGALAFYAEEGWLAFGNQEGQVKVWDPIDRRSLVTFDAHELAIQELAFSADGTWLATTDNTGSIKVWDWLERSLIVEVDNERPALALSLAPDKAMLAAGVSENVRLWSLPDGELQHVLDTGPSATQVMAFSPDSQHLINGGDTPQMMVWNPQTGSLIAQLPDMGEERLTMSFSPDGSLLLTAVLGGPAALWNLTTLTDTTVNRADLDLQGQSAYSVDWTSDGRLLTLFGMTGSVYLWGIPPIVADETTNPGD